MDREMIVERLTLDARGKGKAIIERQRELVARLGPKFEVLFAELNPGDLGLEARALLESIRAELRDYED
jgi:hypothetical protein